LLRSNAAIPLATAVLLAPAVAVRTAAVAVIFAVAGALAVAVATLNVGSAVALGGASVLVAAGATAVRAVDPHATLTATTTSIAAPTDLRIAPTSIL
jgi:ABC-type oligopeptide transport system substrate-binding subunit